jgi:hypothetical protein
VLELVFRAMDAIRTAKAWFAFLVTATHVVALGTSVAVILMRGEAWTFVVEGSRTLRRIVRDFLLLHPATATSPRLLVSIGVRSELVKDVFAHDTLAGGT